MTDNQDIWHHQTLLADLHTDFLSRLIDRTDLFDVGVRNTTGQVDLPRIREGGVDVMVCALFSRDVEKDPAGRAVRQIEKAQLIAANHGVVVVRSGEEVKKAVHEGTIVFLLSIENGSALEGKMDRLHQFHEMGVRAIGLVWNGVNEIGSGSDHNDGSGLTPFGIELVREMGRLGMIVDVSHLNPKGVDDVLTHLEGPIWASHSNARVICDHPRNLTDRHIQAIAERDGVIGMNFYTPFLTSKQDKACVDDIIRHVDYISDLLGTSDTLAIGSDYDGIPFGPVGLEDVSCMPALTRALIAAGYTGSDLEGILGGNAMRVIGRLAT